MGLSQQLAKLSTLSLIVNGLVSEHAETLFTQKSGPIWHPH